MPKKAKPQIPFDDQLVLFKFFLNELRINSLDELSQELNSVKYEGFDKNGNTLFYAYIAHICQVRNARITQESLCLYDENICRHTRTIGQKRGGLKWKYFQYISLLFTEMYLDRYFSDPNALCSDLNAWLAQVKEDSSGSIVFKDYTLEKLNKLAFMCATGSGKTLIMHMNILQFQDYQKRSKQKYNRIIVLAPNEGMCTQHLNELALSSIPASIFDKDLIFTSQQDEVIVIDINKLKDEGKDKTVSVDSFEQNNLVMVDEGHRGLKGEAWYKYRSSLFKEGFSFEYSATFKQAINADSKSESATKKLIEEYGKSIIMDYSYKHFYKDGYGKDYRILNLQEDENSERRNLFLIGCLLSFYQQMKVFNDSVNSLQNYQVEKPLLVFVGNRVTTPVKKGQHSDIVEELITDIEEVIVFTDKFVSNRARSIASIQALLSGDTGLIDKNGRDVFYQGFNALLDLTNQNVDPDTIYEGILRSVFNIEGNAEAPRLQMVNIRQASGEIGLKVGDNGYFGVINIGDTSGLIKKCENKGIIVNNEEIVSDSLFQSINVPNSKINMLIGSRKFIEGWNSWRVSTMGLINFAQGEGSQAIQLFGRGVRLRGYNGCLKRSQKLDLDVIPPEHINIVETLNVFGLKANYMTEFKKYLEKEGVSTERTIHEFKMPVTNNFDKIRDKGLYVISVKDGANFKKQAPRIIMDKPDEGFWKYLLKSKSIIDCRSKIQTIESSSTNNTESSFEPQVLPASILPFLDVNVMFEELQEYKSEKHYYNLSIVKDNLLEILSLGEWYGLLIPSRYLTIDSIEKLEAATKYAILALKSYMDKFYKYEKERWEANRLEFSILDEADSNFVDEYTLTYENQYSTEDSLANTIEVFIEEFSTKQKNNKGLIDFELACPSSGLVMINFNHHLYSPLICMNNCNANILVSPVALNEGEMRFVNYLRKYVNTHTDELNDKSLYLLRNKSKAGMGFFEAGNFYPDFILWIDTPDVQYLTFIDPKGMMHIQPDDPKIEFYRTIKDLEKRLTTDKKKIVLNSFIMSATPSNSLQSWWSSLGVNANKQFREDRNVYSLDDVNCVESMIAKILQ